MRGIQKLGVAAVALAVGVLGASASHALVDDPFTSYTQPANALVMPFDATQDHVSFFVVSNIAGTSPTTDPSFDIPAVTTHWSYWSETCSHLVDVYICLTLNDTVVVDPRDISSIDAANQPYGPKANLDANRGFVVVTAYKTGEGCADASFEGFEPIDDAIVGMYTFANTASGAAFGADAIGLGLDATGSHTELPAIDTSALDIQTFNPENLDASGLVYLALKEAGGSGATASIEVGPFTSNITTNATFYDNLESATSLPDVLVKCAKFGSLIPADNSFIPNTISLLSSGLFRINNFSPAIGKNNKRFIYGVYGQAVDQFGASQNAKYKVSALF
jgi:hypothetical protein